MLDFQKELDKLLALETEPLPQSELTELAAEQKSLLSALNKKQTDISMQVEEIYDIIKDADLAVSAQREEKSRSDRMVKTLIGLCDILEDFCVFAQQSGNETLARQASMMWHNAGDLLEGCAVTRLGERGQALNPEIHTVRAASAAPDVPREHVQAVLQSGYRYMGTVMRKAAVIISSGTEATGHE